MSKGMGVAMESACCIKGCDLPVLALGMCVNHWRMTVKHGSPVAERPLSAINRGLSDEQRFWKSVEKTDGCWLWVASRDYDGYGMFRGTISGVLFTRAHRFSYTLATGEILPADRVVMHSCDNPPCVNPDHLNGGTKAENTADMIAKGRHLNRVMAHAQKIAKLSDDEVKAILRDPRQYSEIAASYDVHPQTIVAIKGRTTRSYVQIDPDEIIRAKRGARGAARSKALTDDDVRTIRTSEERGRLLAQRYGVSPQTITDIRKLRSWTHVQSPSFATAEPSKDGQTLDVVKHDRAPNQQICTVEGCGRPRKAQGFCHTHYMRMRRTGNAGGVEQLSKAHHLGSAHHKSTLTEDQALAILNSTEKGVTLAARYSVKPAVISSIRTGATWKHLTKDPAA
jgi:hypothetical protein